MYGYKFRADVERDIDNTLAVNKLFASSRVCLNDPTEMQFDDTEFIEFLERNKKHSKEVKIQYDSFKNFSQNKTGILSLSKNIDNELLWAYYADGHKGFCIEYDIDVIMESYNYSIELKKERLESRPLVFRVDVDYNNSFPKFTSDLTKRLTESNDFTEGLQCTLGRKSKNWDRENEVRLVFNKYGLIELDYRAVKGIYFGCRFDNSSNEIERIMELLQGRGVKYYKMKFVNSSYIMDFDEIIDCCIDFPRYIANNLSVDSVVSLSVPSIVEPNKDLINKALEIVRKEPCINKIKSYYICLTPTPMIAVETYVNSDFINPDIRNGNIKYYRFDINMDDRTIKLRPFQIHM